MTRNRFLLFTMQNKLMTKRFKDMKLPGEYVLIVKSVVPFCRRLNCKQYIPGKSDKYKRLIAQ